MPFDDHGFNSSYFYRNIYDQSASKWAGISSSLLVIFVMTPTFFFITWYERFGSNHHPTLINQLVATNCWFTILYNLIGQTTEIVLSLFGPFNPIFCYAQVILKNTFSLQQINLFLAMTLTKYLSVFVLKNPLGVDCEFWNYSITLITMMGTYWTKWFKKAR